MESNNESKVLNVNLKTPDETEAEEIDTKAKIEQCFDDNKNVNAVEFIPGEKNGTEIILKKVEVQSEDKKDDSYSDFVDTAKMAKDPKRVAEESSEKGNKSMEVIVTLPTPTSTGVVINEQMMEKPQPEQFKKSGNVKENELVKSEITEGEEGVFIKVDDESIVAAAVDYKDTEAVVNEHTTLGSSAVQPKESQDQVNTEQLKQQEVRQAQKDDCGNNIRNSDIDSNIEQENIALLKRQQKELLEKQKDLTQKIHQQQLIAQHLAKENRIHQQKLQEQKQQQNLSESQTKLQQAARNNPSPFSYKQTLSPYQPQKKISQYLTVEETKDEYGYTQKTEAYESKESTDNTRKIDLQKILTPAKDEIQPRNRKLYASSAFYSPALHPTVEDQVELARRISHSLSDISNQKSKGQTMYVNRKKRSVKWVHEGAGQDLQEEFKENTVTLPTNQNSPYNQVPLRLLMNPHGKVRDITSVSDPFNTETGLLSPDKCAELITALQTQKGKGAELFAKRRRKSGKWVVDETNTSTQSPSGLPDYQQQQQQVRPPTSPSILPAYSDAGKHRVQLNLEQEILLEKYAKPGLKVIKTPWEAALETGSASTAFVEDGKLTPQRSPTPSVTPIPVAQYQYPDSEVPEPMTSNDGYAADYNITPSHKIPGAPFPTSKPIFIKNLQRDLAYKPSLPQGWKSPAVILPKELYLPKDISLDCYTPRAAVHNEQQKNVKTSLPIGGSFSLENPNNLGYLFATPPQTQQYLDTTSYKIVQQETSQNKPQINYSPSPLPYEKIAKFENAAEQQTQNSINSPQRSQIDVQNHMERACYLTASPSGDRLGRNESLSASSYQSSFPKHYEGAHTYTPTSNTKYFSSNEFLHGQNYNNTARGWRLSRPSSANYLTECGEGYKTLDAGNYYTYKPKDLAAVSALPYSDF